jgi:NitT/TauT family transport system substrate-binding protein
VKTQGALSANPGLSTKVADNLFPREEASLIAGLIKRDAPFYDATISVEAVNGLNKFAKANGLIANPIPYDTLVASEFRHLWTGR